MEEIRALSFVEAALGSRLQYRYKAAHQACLGPWHKQKATTTLGVSSITPIRWQTIEIMFGLLKSRHSGTHSELRTFIFLWYGEDTCREILESNLGQA